MSDRPYDRPAETVWQEGDPVDPVTPENPLVVLETLVLHTWLENSSELRNAYAKSGDHKSDIENAVRSRVASTFDRSSYCALRECRSRKSSC